MTLIEVALRDVLMAYTPLTALISTRLTPVVFPQGATYPRVAYEMISDPGQESGLHNDLIQYVAQGSTYLSAETVMSQIKAAFDGYSGIKDDLIISSVRPTGQMSQTCDPTVPVYERTAIFRVIYES